MELPDPLLFALDGARRANGHTVSPAWLWVCSGQVAHLADHPPTDVPEDLPVLNGGWVIEPLADAHVHLFLCGAVDTNRRRTTASLPREQTLERVLHLLEQYRLRGVAAVRDAGDPGGIALEAARIANPRPDRYAAVLAAGEPVYRAGGYGGFLGRGCASVAEARRILEANRAAGATHAKILATGLNSVEVPGRVGAAQFSPAELVEISAAAQALGLPTMVHANGPLGAVLDTRPGSVEHGFWHDPSDRDRMAADEIPWVPTLGAWAELLQSPSLTPSQRRGVENTDARHRGEVRAGVAAGIPVAAGSDAGSPGVSHVGGLQGELERLAAAAGSPLEALAAVRRSLALCQAEACCALGGLRPGSTAGFLWLDRDPAYDLATLRRPRGVFLGGSWSAIGAPGQAGNP